MIKNYKQLQLMHKGSSLIELLIAMGVFVLAVSAISFLILDSYIADRAGSERTQAVFLAEEGLEKMRALNWNSRVTQSPELINNKFTRTISVSDIDADRKQITANISWQITDIRQAQAELVTYLTNWGIITPDWIISCATYCQFLEYGNGTCRQTSSACTTNNEIYESGGDGYCVAPDNFCCCL